MTQQEYVLERKTELRESIKRVENWKQVVGSKEWQVVVQYLEQRYIELADGETPDTLKALTDRNGRMDEIRRLFKFIQHDFNANAVRIRQILEDRELIDEDVPTPFIPY